MRFTTLLFLTALVGLLVSADEYDHPLIPLEPLQQQFFSSHSHCLLYFSTFLGLLVKVTLNSVHVVSFPIVEEEINP